jgi:homoserine kinase type II
VESADLDREELCSILSLYHLEGLEDFGDVAGGAPSRVYWVRVSGRRYLLRISSRRRFKDMLFEKDFLTQLRATGLPVPRLIENVASGAFTPWTSRGRYISLFEDLGGRRLGVFELRTRHTRAIGEFLGKMHSISSRIAAGPPNEFELAHLEELHQRTKKTFATAKGEAGYGADLAQLEAELAEQKKRKPKGELGAVHADLFIGNARFRDDRLVGVLDFDRACRDRLNWDLAVAINAWCWEPTAKQAGGPAGAFSKSKLRALLSAYQSVKPIAEPDRKELPADLRLISVRFALGRLVEFEIKRARKDSPYKDYRHFLARLDVLQEGGAEQLIAEAL